MDWIRLSLRLPADLHAELADLADRDERSLNKFIELRLRECLKTESQRWAMRRVPTEAQPRFKAKR